MNTESMKTSEPHKFVPTLSQVLDLQSLNKYIALQNYLLHVEKYKTIV